MSYLFYFDDSLFENKIKNTNMSILAVCHFVTYFESGTNFNINKTSGILYVIFEMQQINLFLMRWSKKQAEKRNKFKRELITMGI